MRSFTGARTGGAIVFSFILLLSGCSVRNEVFVAADGSGEVRFAVELSTFLLETLQDIAAVSGEAEDSLVLDPERIREGFAGQGMVTLTRLEQPSPTSLNGSFTFESVNRIFADEDSPVSGGIVRFEERGGEKRVEVRITRENFSSLSGLAPFLDNPFLVMFGPEENEGVSEDEYLEMMEYALGSGASALIRESSVVLVFRVEGRVVSQKGGVASGETVTFNIPLIDLLLLSEPLEYSIVYR